MFKIGLNDIAARDWLEIDDRRDEYLKTKAELHRTSPDDVFAMEEGTGDSQLETLKLVQAFMLEYYGLAAGWREEEIPALMQAASIIQEDLVILRPDKDDWRVVAASVCFPSNWWLREKMGLPISLVHDPIPGFELESQNARIIRRILNSLQVGSIVERFNWTLDNCDKLTRWPLERGAGQQREYSGGIFMRVERQTLRKLPQSGDILFTIRIHVEPLSKLYHHRDGSGIARRLAEELGRLGDGELRYKGLYEARDMLLAQLEKIILGNGVG